MLPILFSDTGATSQDGSHSAIFRMQGPEGCACARLLSLEKPHLPTIEKETRLVDLVGPRSWLLFNVLQIEGTFLHKATGEWEEDEEFFKFSRYARNLKVNAKKD